jgi:MYXO-CTERM domain-containing protein
VDYLQQHNYTLNDTLVAILERYLTVPSDYQNDPVDYYTHLQSYINIWHVNHDGDAGGAVGDGGPETLDLTFDPIALTDEIDMRVVKPTLDAGALLRSHPYLTRLFTTLSPADMTEDPVFSFNPDLADVKLEHVATYTRVCNSTPWLKTETGLESNYIIGMPAPTMPASLRIEILREAGPALIATDNQATIQTKLGTDDHTNDTQPAQQASANPKGGCGCASDGMPRGDLALFGALLLGALGLRIVRSRRGRLD